MTITCSYLSTDGFIFGGLFYVVAVIICLLLLALIVAVTICCVVHKKKTTWELQAQNGGYSDRNEEAINGGAVGEMTDGENPGSFDFDAVAESMEMKVISMALTPYSHSGSFQVFT